MLHAYGPKAIARRVRVARLTHGPNYRSHVLRMHVIMMSGCMVLRLYACVLVGAPARVHACVRAYVGKYIIIIIVTIITIMHAVKFISLLRFQAAAARPAMLQRSVHVALRPVGWRHCHRVNQTGVRRPLLPKPAQTARLRSTRGSNSRPVCHAPSYGANCFRERVIEGHEINTQSAGRCVARRVAMCVSAVYVTPSVTRRRHIMAFAAASHCSRQSHRIYYLCAIYSIFMLVPVS